MAPIDDNDEVIDVALVPQEASEDVKALVKEKAKPKTDPKTTIDPVFSCSVLGLTHPISPNEEQMLQLFTGAPLSSAYNIAQRIPLLYPIDAATCVKGIEILNRRHDILRSTYHLGMDAVPLRRIHHNNPGNVLVIHVDKPEDIETFMMMDNARPHQLGVTCARFMVFAVRNDHGKMGAEVAPQIWFLLHHIAADADGQGVAARELDLIYSYLFRGFSEEAIMQMLPPITVQFSDYSYWQISLENRGLLREDSAVWYQSITSACPPMVLDLQMDIPRPKYQIAIGSSSKCRLEQALLNPVLDRIPATPYTLVFTTFTIVLSRLARQPFVHVAIPYGTRANPSLYPLIGSFLNMLPAMFEYHASDSFGAVFDRCAAIQLAARKYALAPFLTIVNMLRPHTGFDPSRNPVYQAMLDMLPGGEEEEDTALEGVMDIFQFAYAPNAQMKHISCNYNSTLFTKTMVNRFLLQQKAVHYIIARQATGGLSTLYNQPLPVMLASPEEAFLSSSACSLGSYPLKIYANNGEDSECTVNLAGGFAFKGTPDEWDFMRRSRKFARHSGVMPTTDNRNKYGLQYQFPPIPPKKKGQQQERIVLPDAEVDETYEKPDVEAVLEWPQEEAEEITKPTRRQSEGVIVYHDAVSGIGMIRCSTVTEDIPFSRKDVPVKNRPKGVVLEGKKVAFTLYSTQGWSYAAGLRFLEDSAVS